MLENHAKVVHGTGYGEAEDLRAYVAENWESDRGGDNGYEEDHICEDGGHPEWCLCPICEGAFEVAALWENSDSVYVCTDEGVPDYPTGNMDVLDKRLASS